MLHLPSLSSERSLVLLQDGAGLPAEHCMAVGCAGYLPACLSLFCLPNDLFSLSDEGTYFICPLNTLS